VKAQIKLETRVTARRMEEEDGPHETFFYRE